MATRKKLGEILVENGATTPDAVKRALGHQRQWGGKIGRILLEMSAITDEQLARALGAQSRMPLAKMKPDTPLSITSLVPLELAERKTAVAFGLRAIEGIETVYVAVADPYDVVGMDEIRFALGKPVKFAVAPESAIRAAIEQLRDALSGLPELEGPAEPRAGARSAPAAPPPPSGRHPVPLARIQITQAPAHAVRREIARAITPPPLEEEAPGPGFSAEVDHSSPAEVLAEMASSPGRRGADQDSGRISLERSSGRGTEPVLLELSEAEVVAEAERLQEPFAGNLDKGSSASDILAGLTGTGETPSLPADPWAARNAASLFDEWDVDGPVAAAPPTLPPVPIAQASPPEPPGREKDPEAVSRLETPAPPGAAEAQAATASEPAADEPAPGAEEDAGPAPALPPTPPREWSLGPELRVVSSDEGPSAVLELAEEDAVSPEVAAEPPARAGDEGSHPEPTLDAGPDEAPAAEDVPRRAEDQEATVQPIVSQDTEKPREPPPAEGDAFEGAPSAADRAWSALESLARGVPCSTLPLADERPAAALARLLHEQGMLTAADLINMVAAPADRILSGAAKVLIGEGWLTAADLVPLLGFGPARVGASLLTLLVARERFSREEVARALT